MKSLAGKILADKLKELARESEALETALFHRLPLCIRQPTRIDLEDRPRFSLWAWSVCRWVLLAWGEYADCLLALEGVERWRHPVIVQRFLEIGL